LGPGEEDALGGAAAQGSWLRGRRTILPVCSRCRPGPVHGLHRPGPRRRPHRPKPRLPQGAVPRRRDRAPFQGAGNRRRSKAQAAGRQQAFT
jgi:hypothetical protein